MSKFINIIILFLLFVGCSLKREIPLNIYIDITRDYYVPYNGLGVDTIKQTNGEILVINLTSYKGRMSFYLIDSAGNKRLEGEYKNSLTKLKKYTHIVDPIYPDIVKLRVLSYFSPVRHGVWIYYKDDKVNYYEEYDTGIIKPKLRNRDFPWVTEVFGVIPKSAEPGPSFFGERYFED